MFLSDLKDLSSRLKAGLNLEKEPLALPVDDIKLRPPIFKFTLKNHKQKIVFFKGKITYIKKS